MAWVHQKAKALHHDFLHGFCGQNAPITRHGSESDHVYILPPVLTDDPGDEAEADHGDDPGGQQTLHGGVMSQYYVTIMSQYCVTILCHAVSRSHDPPARLTKVY